MRRIGIPRALLYHKYGDQWKSFFEELGFSVVLSDNTNKVILNEGVKNAIDEACLPLKVYYGHVLNLINKVDCIFIPRYISTVMDTKTCPKMIGLPDIIRHSVADVPKIISPTFNISEGSMKREIFFLALRLTLNPLKSLRATKKFFLNETNREIKIEKNKLNIGIVSHSYVLGDNYLNQDINKELEKRGINVISTEDIGEKELSKKNRKLSKPLYWSFEREILGSAYYFIDNKKIGGLIHMTAFACGPDSVVAEMIKEYSYINKKPYLKLSLDEHTGKAGFITRIEAFIDMIGGSKC